MLFYGKNAQGKDEFVGSHVDFYRRTLFSRSKGRRISSDERFSEKVTLSMQFFSGEREQQAELF